MKWMGFVASLIVMMGVGGVAGYGGLSYVFQTGLPQSRVLGSTESADEVIDAVVDETRELQLILVGDVMLGRAVMGSMRKYGSVDWPWEEVSERLSQSDLVIGNLENVVYEGCELTWEGMRLCAQPDVLTGVKTAGFDVLSLANNHINDFGSQEALATKTWVEAAGMQAVPHATYVTGKRQGVSYAVVGYDVVGHTLNEDQLYDLVRQARSEVQVVIVMMHWGAEYKADPHESQQRLGRGLVEAGADIVVGAHPHWVQPVEEYNKGLIFYSLGNFVFDQMWSEETKRGMAVEMKVTVGHKGVEEMKYKLIQSEIRDYGRVSWRQVGM